MWKKLENKFYWWDVKEIVFSFEILYVKIWPRKISSIFHQRQGNAEYSIKQKKHLSSNSSPMEVFLRKFHKSMSLQMSGDSEKRHEEICRESKTNFLQLSLAISSACVIFQRKKTFFLLRRPHLTMDKLTQLSGWE